MTATTLLKKATLLNTEIIQSVMVLAPHPDDESLGCGGLISLLAESNKKVCVVFITDGSMSHPNSKKYPAGKLAATRKTEALAALHELQVAPCNIFFMNKKDRALPGYNEKGFEQNANELKHIIDVCRPGLIIVPYEKDPHPDHRATWQMLMQVRNKTQTGFSILEYMIWLYNLGTEKDLPAGDAVCRCVDITKYIQQKQNAISCHVSQTTRLIDDDPGGFMLTADVLQHFNGTKEYFLDRNL